MITAVLRAQSLTSATIPVTWLAAWSALAFATVALAWMLRTRWREMTPWKKCAILSLWVHALLALLAATVRISAGGASGSGDGWGEPIRVAIASIEPVNDETAPAPQSSNPANVATPIAEVADEPSRDPLPVETETETPSALEEAASERQPALEATSLSVATSAFTRNLKVDENLDAPDLLAEPIIVPTQDGAVAPLKSEPSAEEAALSQASTAPVDEQASRTEAALASAAPANESEPPPVEKSKGDGSESTLTSTNAPSGPIVDLEAVAKFNGLAGVPAPYANRFGNRESALSAGGGNAATEHGVAAALAWLVDAQAVDGRWNPKQHGAGQERFVLGEDRRGAGARADTGISSLALLALLGAGHTHRQGPYADHVRRGLDFLRRSQAPNGDLGGDAELFARMYCHAMATFALSEAAATTGDQSLVPVIRQAVRYSLAAQHPTDGGWRYQPGHAGDTSQLGWQLMALRSAELAGVEVPPVAWTRAERFLRSVQRGASNGLAAYRPEGPPTRAMTAEALFCRQLLANRRDGGLTTEGMSEARQALVDDPPGGKLVNFYYWYYATIALHRARDHSPACAAAWERWNESLTSALLTSQADDGSWPPTCLWGGYGGRVYSTALGAMCLEVYYRYAQDQEVGVAAREQWRSGPAR